MLKPHVLALIASFTAASVRAAIPSTDAAALIFDPSNGVDSSEKRNLREKFPDVTDDERMWVTMAHLKDLVQRYPLGFSVDQLHALHNLNVLGTFNVEVSDVNESFFVILQIVPPVSYRPGDLVWMALGDAYFKQHPFTLSSDSHLLTTPAKEEARLGAILEKNNIEPATAIYKFRLLVQNFVQRGIPPGFLRSMALGSEIMARARRELDEGLSLTPITFEGINVGGFFG
ncbi:hypothetical protein PsorP6_007776 [Peronosclerospora sorghi]|uniref:Uncharacterized protein n=1 Tax=Peronosclerospora sorghi TaxID=230839 RepID=A0ACC0WAV2_9STRA|nr:hypothetical protein PsorP6_007776 [Peronosclerospora sorghi]